MYCWWIIWMEYDCWGWVGVEYKLGQTVGVKVLVFQLWQANIALYACSDKLKLFCLSSTFWDCWGWGIYVLQRVLLPFLCDSGLSAMVVLWQASIAPYACSDKLGLCCVCSTLCDCCGRNMSFAACSVSFSFWFWTICNDCTFWCCAFRRGATVHLLKSRPSLLLFVLSVVFIQLFMLSVSTGPCDIGYYCERNASTATPIDGTTGNICPAGTYCPTGTATPLPCDDGQCQI